MCGGVFFFDKQLNPENRIWKDYTTANGNKNCMFCKHSFEAYKRSTG